MIKTPFISQAIAEGDQVLKLEAWRYGGGSYGWKNNTAPLITINFIIYNIIYGIIRQYRLLVGVTTNSLIQGGTMLLYMQERLSL